MQDFGKSIEDVGKNVQEGILATVTLLAGDLEDRLFQRDAFGSEESRREALKLFATIFFIMLLAIIASDLFASPSLLAPSHHADPKDLAKLNSSYFVLGVCSLCVPAFVLYLGSRVVRSGLKFEQAFFCLSLLLTPWVGVCVVLHRAFFWAVPRLNPRASSTFVLILVVLALFTVIGVWVIGRVVEATQRVSGAPRWKAWTALWPFGLVALLLGALMFNQVLSSVVSVAAGARTSGLSR